MSNENSILNFDELVKDIVAANPNDPTFKLENVLLAGKSKEMAQVIDQLYIQCGLGAVKSGLTRSLYGINFAGTPNQMPVNRDTYGMTFFTRPLLNLSEANIRNNRIMSQLLNKDKESMHCLLRCYLDPRIFDEESRASVGYGSPFLNEKSPFISILSNNLLSMSGWPDFDAQLFTSAAGNFREEYSYVDGVVKHYGTWDATCSFRNIDGNMIVNIFFYWLLYQASVAVVGDLLPYPIMNLGHEIDYNTAIWRMTFSPDRKRITGIARTIAYPITCPIGAQFNFESDSVYNTENEQTSIQFKCHGAEYNDDILIDEFNMLVEIFDPDFRYDTREKNYVQIPPSMWRLFNGMAQPRINPATDEMEWWVTIDDYSKYRPMFANLPVSLYGGKSIVEQVAELNANERNRK